MIDFLIVLALAALGVASLMEAVKAIVNAINASLVKKRIGDGAEGDFTVPRMCGGSLAAYCHSRQPFWCGSRCLRPTNR
jgi:hypothetical protein